MGYRLKTPWYQSDTGFYTETPEGVNLRSRYQGLILRDNRRFPGRVKYVVLTVLQNLPK